MREEFLGRHIKLSKLEGRVMREGNTTAAGGQAKGGKRVATRIITNQYGRFTKR